jgi:cobalt-zinc-cadmium efflux system outer membrane protein
MMTEYNFYDLLRTLRFSLRSNYYSMLHLHQSYSAYQAQISSLEKLSNAYHDLQAKGVVTLKDAVRIKSLLYTLQGEQTSLQNQLNDVQAEFQLLMRDNKHYYLPADTSGIVAAADQFPLQALVDSAYNNRFDLKAAAANMTYSEQNYRLQKALRTPDLTLGAEFDRRGSYVNNATLLNAAIDLPFFNRNQGNIKAARIGIDQSKARQQQQQQMVENEVQKAYIKALNTERMLQSLDPGFKDQFGQLLKGITENFEKKNISLLEFTDFYESYKDNILRINQLQNEKDQAKEALNFAVGKTLFN